MDTLPLPPRPDLAQYRKRAKDLVKAAGSTEPDAVRAWATEWLDALARLRGQTVTPFVQESLDRVVERIEQQVRERPANGTFTLAEAQYLIARAHSFASWRDFAEHVERLSRSGAEADPFESAADAVVTGDLPALESLLSDNPALIHTRSARVHRATLLHYSAANGVEDFRQLTPPNAVATAKSLLEAGAEVDALAETYGGGKAQTTMNLLVSSTHPAEAGLQPALVEVLLDFGAAINGVEDDGTPLMTALAFGYPDAAETLVRRGARIDNLMAAAALGRVELLRAMLAEGATVRPSLVNLYWLGLSSDPDANLERALVWAAAFGRTAVVDFLLAHGVDPAATDNNAMTGLHWAAANRHLDVVKLLIERGAPLEARNRWGGTVLDSTVYFALQPSADWTRYSAVMETLIDAGADVSAVPYPTGSEAVDEFLARYGPSSGIESARPRWDDGSNPLG
jgi:ankyrin repeat protein